MSTRESARKVLRETEASLRGIMEQGLKEQRYAEVAEIAGIAEAVSRLLRGNGTAPAATENTSSPAAPTVQRSSTLQAPKSPRRSGKVRESRYPRFEREGSRLIKVGWSKKHKGEYEHRAPREAVIAFSRHLMTEAAPAHVFAIEDVMPVPDPSGGGEIPAYQVYLTLKWLQKTGAVAKKGRDGYVRQDIDLAGEGLDKLWDALPVRGA